MNTKSLSIQLITATTLLISTQAAFSLSCVRPDPVRSCKHMQSEGKSPVWANGELKLHKIISQESNERNLGGKGPAVADYLFSGSLSDKSGTRDVKNTKLRITTSCAGPWCANLPQSGRNGYFLFEPNGESAVKLHIGACTFQPFTVTEQQVRDVAACATPEPVEPKEPEVNHNSGSSQIYSQQNNGKKLVQ